MPFDRRTPPYLLSPEAWNLGFNDFELAVQISNSGAGESEHEEGHEQRSRLFDRLNTMTANELRAYIDGMHSAMGEHFD